MSVDLALTEIFGADVGNIIIDLVNHNNLREHKAKNINVLGELMLATLDIRYSIRCHNSNFLNNFLGIPDVVEIRGYFIGYVANQYSWQFVKNEDRTKYEYLNNDYKQHKAEIEAFRSARQNIKPIVERVYLDRFN